MNETFVTYASANAPEERTWVAYVVLESGEYLGIRFEGSKEMEALSKAKEFWAKDEHTRETNRQNRLDALAKARDAKERKRAQEAVE